MIGDLCCRLAGLERKIGKLLYLLRPSAVAKEKQSTKQYQESKEKGDDSNEEVDGQWSDGCGGGCGSAGVISPDERRKNSHCGIMVERACFQGF